jgi:hypothetical protein
VEGRGEVLTQGENAWLLVLINKRAREVMMMPKAMRGNRLLICYLFKVRERESTMVKDRFCDVLLI